MEVEHLADALNKLSEIIRGQRHWDEVRKDLLGECRVLFDAEVCALFRVRNDYVELEDHIGYTKSDGTLISLTDLRKALRYKVGRIDDGGSETPQYDGITGQVATTGEECSFDSTSLSAPSWRGKPADLEIWSETRPFRCMVAVPLKIDTDVIGVLKVENKKISQGEYAPFDQIDRAVLRALGNLFSIASKFSYFRGLPYQALVDTTLTWLEQFDRQNLYHKMVEFCSHIFHADVCALYVRAEHPVTPKMTLVAGRLRDGDAMDPAELSKDGQDPNYLIGLRPDGTYDGITGEIATIGQPAKIDKYQDIHRPSDKIGKWDSIVWDGDPAANFLCMIGVPLFVNDRTGPIGILKVERARSNSQGIFHDEDLDILTQVAAGFAVHVNGVLSSGTKLIPGREHEYRITRAQRGEFKYKSLGGIRIRHLMTSICQSDLDYFNHRKNDHKLDERLPMPLGHETVGEVLHANPDAQDLNGKKIRAGDRLFVIPLIPCGSCNVCEQTKNYGENYCQSSRFMASNAPGSLRSSYEYDAGLTIQIADELASHLAVFAEPMANVVQLLEELGFSDNAVGLNMKPFEKQDFTFFRVQGQQFSNIFNTIIEQEPNLRTLYVLSNADALTIPTVRNISQQGLMRKGLALLGRSKLALERADYARRLENPRVLILGNGVSAYLLAVVLTQAYAIPLERITVTGRTQAKLDQFARFAAFRLNVQNMPDDTIISNLKNAVGSPEDYDIVFEMAGGAAIEKNLDIALRVLKRRGIIAMFGLTDKPIEVDFAKVILTEAYVKGSYRASLVAYSRALEYITKYKPIQDALLDIIDNTTEINGYRGPVHDIHSEGHLTELFRAAGRSRGKLGRLIVGRFIHESS